jgi:hypothetical protein
MTTQRPSGGADASWAALYFESTPWHPPMTPFPFLFTFTDATSNATVVCAHNTGKFAPHQVKSTASARRRIFLLKSNDVAPFYCLRTTLK